MLIPRDVEKHGGNYSSLRILVVNFGQALSRSALRKCAEVAEAADESLVKVVVNRDVEGAGVGEASYQPTATACRDTCVETEGCNIWVWCADSQGCLSGGSSYQKDLKKYKQCWLKYDNPEGSPFPNMKNSPSQATGWISGTLAGDSGTGAETTYSDCRCKSSWTAYVDDVEYEFQGTCANTKNSYQAECEFDRSTCTGNMGSETVASCQSPQACSAFLDFDAAGSVLDPPGDLNYQSSAEMCCSMCADTQTQMNTTLICHYPFKKKKINNRSLAHKLCCSMCAKTQFCSVWAWCSDPSGCPVGEYERYRQCWLKSMVFAPGADLEGEFKAARGRLRILQNVGGKVHQTTDKAILDQLPIKLALSRKIRKLGSASTRTESQLALSRKIRKLVSASTRTESQLALSRKIRKLGSASTRTESQLALSRKIRKASKRQHANRKPVSAISQNPKASKRQHANRKPVSAISQNPKASKRQHANRKPVSAISQNPKLVTVVTVPAPHSASEVTYQNQASKDFFGVLACPEETLWKHLFGTCGTKEHQALVSEIMDTVKVGKEYEMNVQLVTFIAPAASNRKKRFELPTIAETLNSIAIFSAENPSPENSKDDNLMYKTIDKLDGPSERLFKVTARAILDQQTSRQCLLIFHEDITEPEIAYNKLATLTEAQLSLLAQSYPKHVLDALCLDHSRIGESYGALARSHQEVTILFMDIVGFTNMSKEVNAAEVLNFLNALFSLFDALCDTHGVSKVETAGDCYIVAGGIMEHDMDDGFSKVLASHDAGHGASNMTMPHNDKPVVIRIGIHTGNCVSGVIGTKLPKFSIFGDTMNTASRMESSANHGTIQVSADTHSTLLADGNTEKWAATGGIEVARLLGQALFGATSGAGF
eukprot:gene10412-8360_t